jgi:hypothetical protein
MRRVAKNTIMSNRERERERELSLLPKVFVFHIDNGLCPRWLNAAAQSQKSGGEERESVDRELTAQII